MKSSVALLIVGALLFSGAVLGDEKKASSFDFDLKDTDGKSHKLSDLKDKIVVLEWTETGCPAVKPLYKSKTMQKLAADYKKKGVVWLAVVSTAGQTKEQLNKFRKTYGVQHPFLLDLDGKVGRHYGAKKTPHMFVLQGGEVKYQGAIDDKKDNNYVAKAVDELLAGKPVSNPRTKPYG